MLIISPFLYRVISKFINIQFRMINYNNLHFACKVRYRSVNKRGSTSIVGVEKK